MQGNKWKIIRQLQNSYPEELEHLVNTMIVYQYENKKRAPTWHPFPGSLLYSD